MAKIGINVGELRKLLAEMPELTDDMDVVVRDTGSESETGFCGGIYELSVEYAHDENDTPFLVIDCSQDEDDFDAG